IRKWIVVGEEAHLLELLCSEQRRRRLVRKDAQRLQLVGGRKQAILGIVRPDHAERGALAVVQRNDQRMVVPRVRAAAVALRAVLDRTAVETLAHIIATDTRA